MLIVSPYHLDEPLPVFDYSGPRDVTIAVDLPDVNDRWTRMELVYEQLAENVAASADAPVIIAGDCSASLGVLAGLQGSAHDLGIVWFDAHGDFNTEQTTTSGYLGGLPLALAVGIGTPRLPRLGLRPVPAGQALLVDARDLDPAEAELLASSDVRRALTTTLTEHDLPTGSLYLHIDVDVCDPAELHNLLYPTSGGPSLDELRAAMHRIISTGRVAATTIAATFHHGGKSAAANDAALRSLLAIVRPDS
jgi:arginase